MRIWDIDPALLCRSHLLGEHRELHGLWNILTQGKKGYRNHPETQRWVEHLHMLARRHEAQVAEMQKRGYRHRSPLAKGTNYTALLSVLIRGNKPLPLVNTIEEQIELLRTKACECRV